MTEPRVLIVDDDPAIRPLLVAVCRRAGYSCTTAVDGVDAMKKIWSETFDLVLLDLMMPRMNGYEVIHTLDEMATAPKVVVLTAQAPSKTSGLEPGKGVVRAVLQKPFDLDALTAVLQQMLNGGSGEAPQV